MVCKKLQSGAKREKYIEIFSIAAPTARLANVLSGFGDFVFEALFIGSINLEINCNKWSVLAGADK